MGTKSLMGLVALAIAWSAAPEAVARQSRITSRSQQGYAGWNYLEITNGDVVLHVTLDIGPRVIAYALAPTKAHPEEVAVGNMFKVYADQIGTSGETEWKIRGGHRLWVAPEDLTRTYALDNAPVEWNRDPETGEFMFKAAPDTTYGIQKTLRLKLAESGSKVTLTHEIQNIGEKPTSLSVWALTVMRPGGVEIIPMPRGIPHPGAASNATTPADFGHDRLMVLWPYFDFNDPRWTFGSRFLMLRHDEARGPTKLGLANRLGLAGYWYEGTLFVKRFPFVDSTAEKPVVYPDGGVNFETFTNQDMLEIETMGPIVTLEPQASAQHGEEWELFADVSDCLEHEGLIEREILPRMDGSFDRAPKR